MGEIGACEGYECVLLPNQNLSPFHVSETDMARSSHAYLHLPLLPKDEYLAIFPDQAELSEQEMMPLRIEYEKQEREKMEVQRLELVRVKEALGKENARRKEELRKIDEKIEAVVEGFRGVEEGLAKDL